MALVVKNPPANAGGIRDADSVPGSERSPGEGHDNPFQDSCLENPIGQRSLAGYSPWGRKESDMTKRLTLLLPLCVYPGFYKQDQTSQFLRKSTLNIHWKD